MWIVLEKTNIAHIPCNRGEISKYMGTQGQRYSLISLISSKDIKDIFGFMFYETMNGTQIHMDCLET